MSVDLDPILPIYGLSAVEKRELPIELLTIIQVGKKNEVKLFLFYQTKISVVSANGMQDRHLPVN